MKQLQWLKFKVWPRGFQRFLREYAESLLIAVVIAIILRLFVVSAYQISSSSMEPTLQAGDFVVAYKVPFGVSLPGFDIKIWGGRKPERGTVVAFHCPGQSDATCVKRIVALPGDRVEMQGGRLIINGEMAEYSRLPKQGLVLAEQLFGDRRRITFDQDKTLQNVAPIIVPPEHVFVLGDNRTQSKDSRHFGAVPITSVQAEILFVWMSFDWGRLAGSFPGIRWQRLFESVD